MRLLLTVTIVFLILLGSEVWWRHTSVHGEFNRKLIHISVGSFVAFWPFFLSWKEIIILSLAFLVVVGISKYLRIFQAIHSVQRPTWGEIYFALAVGVIALMTNDRLIYMAALLLMSLADGLAAVIGVRYGNGGRYKVFGQTKSIVGSATFLIVALLILLGYSHYAPQPATPFLTLGLFAIAFIATIIENIAVAGLDNLLVPVAAAIMLSVYK